MSFEKYKFYCFWCDGLFESEKGHEEHLGGSYWIKEDWTKEIKKEVLMKKWNYVEGSGNLTKDPTKRDKVTFLSVALWKRKVEAGKKEIPTTFVDVSFFGKNKEKLDKLNLEKGQSINFSGELNNRKNSQGFVELGIVGYKLEKIEKKKKEEEENE